MKNRINSIVDACTEDRENVAKLHSYSWARRCELDLLLKMLRLLWNSIGTAEGQSRYIYVDEINNGNMRNNLLQTAKAVGCGESSYLMFYSSSVRHIKAGYIWPIMEMLGLSFCSLPAVFSFIFSKKHSNRILSTILVRYMLRYLKKIDSSSIYVLMTDHHFYSTVIAMSGLVTSVVLQHGLMQDIRFFSPIRADYFFAWSAKSADKLQSDRALACGTYKFKFRRNNAIKLIDDLSDVSRALVLLSSSVTTAQISSRLMPILKLQDIFGFKLLVKTHPGSLFSIESLRDAVGNADIEIYKEEKIEDLIFDFAFIEQSTAVIDVACLGIPFIVIDEAPDSYFRSYQGELPIARSGTELISVGLNYSRRNFENAYRDLLINEINSGKCQIKEVLSSLLTEVEPRER